MGERDGAGEIIRNLRNWKRVATGGDTETGHTGGLGRCPCQHEWRVNTGQTRFDRRPTDKELKACLAKPPPPDKQPKFRCPGDCVQVTTHVWHGWVLYRHKKKTKWILNCNTYTQHHCKKPDDPKRKRPPKKKPPKKKRPPRPDPASPVTILADVAGLDAAERAGLDVIENWRDWKLVARGGTTELGILGGKGLCPGRKVYSVNSVQTFYGRRPTDKELNGCLIKPPEPKPAEAKCPDDCVMVLTHIWHGWMLYHHPGKGRWHVNCLTFAQYECMKPNDKRRKDKPKKKPPKKKPPPRPDLVNPAK